MEVPKNFRRHVVCVSYTTVKPFTWARECCGCSEVGSPWRWIVLVRNLCCGQEATVGTEDRETEWSPLDKGSDGGACHLCSFHPYVEYMI